MRNIFVLSILVFTLAGVLPAKANWVVDGSGNVTRTQILGDEVEKKEEIKKEEKQENKKKEDDKKMENKKYEKREEIKKEIKEENGKLKIEMQKGPVQLKIEKEGDVLKIKGKDENGEEFEMETKKNEKVEIRNKENPRDDFEIASGSGKTVRVKQGEIEAETELPLIVDIKTQKMSVEGREIKVMPDEAVKNSGISNTKVELKNRGREVVYEIKGEEKKKLFGFIDFTFNKASVVSSDTGKVLENTQAWWSSLLETFAR